MKRTILHAALLLLLAAGFLAAGRGASASGTEGGGRGADSQLAQRGWAVDSLELTRANEPGVRSVHARGRIALPARQVWDVLSGEVRAKSESWPGIKESILESVSGDTVTRRYVVGVPVYKDRRYRMSTVCDPSRMRVDFWQIPGYGNVREIRGSWRVVPLGDALTRLDYDVDVDPGVRWVPRFIVNWATKSAIPRLYDFIHERGARPLQEGDVSRDDAPDGAAR